jgi:signal peptidase II
LVPWVAFLLTFVLDQATKVLVQSSLHLGESVQVIGLYVKITYIHNPKGAFGLPIGGKLFFVIFSVLASLFILYYLFKIPKEKVWSKGSLALILGGAVGNLIDRFRLGEVIDFIDVGIRTTRWPIFNVADSAVTIGVILLLYALLLKKES